MALGQCRNIIRELKLKPVVAADTAGSAREVAEAKDLTRSAIASRLAAEIYGLDILKENVEDEIAFDDALYRPVAGEKMGSSQARARSSRLSSSGCATCRPRSTRRSAASPTNGVNMTKLESYMVGGNFFATQFYADVEGHPDDRALVFALEELAFFSKELTVLGVYPAHPFRETFKEARRISAGVQTATRPRNPSMPLCSLVAAASTVSDASSTLLGSAARFADRLGDFVQHANQSLCTMRRARDVMRDLVGCAVLLLQ